MIVQSFIHFCNLYISVLFSSASKNGSKKADECAWYFTSFVIDLFPGMLIIWGLNSLVQKGLEKLNMRRLINGNYALNSTEGKNIDYFGYMGETIVWLLIQLTTKFVLFFFVRFFFEWMNAFSHEVLQILDFSSFFKLLFVMVLFPLVVDVLIFWISDNLLKKNVWYEDELPLMTTYFEANDSAALLRSSVRSQSNRLVEVPSIRVNLN